MIQWDSGERKTSRGNWPSTISPPIHNGKILKTLNLYHLLQGEITNFRFILLRKFHIGLCVRNSNSEFVRYILLVVHYYSFLSDFLVTVTASPGTSSKWLQYFLFSSAKTWIHIIYDIRILILQANYFSLIFVRRTLVNLWESKISLIDARRVDVEPGHVGDHRRNF